ncbi:MAG: sialidase family protein [Blastocatellia bacterium]
MKKIHAPVFVSITFFALMAAGLSPWPSPAEAQFASQFGATRFPAIDVDKSDNLYLMMSVATASDRPHSQIFFTMSRDSGTTWNNFPTTRNLSKSKGEAFGPSVAVTKNGVVRVYVVYHDDSNGITQAYLIRSKKKTKFKTKPANITPHNGGAFSPRIALDSGEGLNVVWGDAKEAGLKVVYVRSTDQGSTFTDPLIISGASTTALNPEVAVDSQDGVNVVWQDEASGVSAVMFVRSTDGGASFSTPKRVSTGEGGASEAQIDADASGRLNVVWVDESGGSSQAYYSRSTDHGETFSDPINASNIADGNIHKPVVEAFNNIVYLAYQEGDLFGEDNGDRQVFLATSIDGGLTFGAPRQVSRADGSCGRAHSPAMVVDSRGMLHIVWIDASVVRPCADEGILFYRNTTDGRRFSSQKEILALIL